MKTIHINLVAYCDNEVKPTLDNIFKTAQNPERVFVGLVNQDDDKFEYKGKFKDHVKHITITPEESDGYGACRKIAQKKFFDHDYYFQIAPHSRLLENWDKKMIAYYESKSGKHIIVSTPSSYDMDNDKKEFLFFVDGIQSFHEHAVFHYQPCKTLKFNKDGMKKTYTFFAGCIFAGRDWVEEVGYDDKIFLYGEEPDLNLRTFGAGYTAWLIKEEIVWHLWGRKNRKALGHIREKELYYKRNFDSKKYIIEKLLNKGYTKQDEFFSIMGLTYENLKEVYNKLIGVKMNNIRATAKFSRNYSTGFKTRAGNDFDVPMHWFKKHPDHFIVKMEAVKPKKIAKKVVKKIKKIRKKK